MPARPSIWDYLPQPERDQIPPRDRQDRQVWPGYWIYHNRDDSISFGTEEREYFGWLPAEITRAVPESLINTIASMVCHAHRMGRKEAYNFLKQFVLEQMRVPDWPHYPMNDLRKITRLTLPAASPQTCNQFRASPIFRPNSSNTSTRESSPSRSPGKSSMRLDALPFLRN
jgi:hypothetical protein